jgi:hypothetical protein
LATDFLQEAPEQGMQLNLFQPHLSVIENKSASPEPGERKGPGRPSKAAKTGDKKNPEIKN